MRWLWLVLLAGCVTSATTRAANVRRVFLLQPGIARDSVLAIMGTAPGRTAQFGDPIPNPYKTESYAAQGRRIEVLYYYTNLQKQDGAVTDDELTPLVLVDGKLDGWGWGYWNSLVQKYEIRIR